MDLSLLGISLLALIGGALIGVVVGYRAGFVAGNVYRRPGRRADPSDEAGA